MRPTVEVDQHKIMPLPTSCVMTRHKLSQGTLIRTRRLEHDEKSWAPCSQNIVSSLTRPSSTFAHTTFAMSLPKIHVIPTISPSTFTFPDPSCTLTLTATLTYTHPITICTRLSIFNLDLAQNRHNFSCQDLATNTRLSLSIESPTLCRVSLCILDATTISFW